MNTAKAFAVINTHFGALNDPVQCLKGLIPRNIDPNVGLGIAGSIDLIALGPIVAHDKRAFHFCRILDTLGKVDPGSVYGAFASIEEYYKSPKAPHLLSDPGSLMERAQQLRARRVPERIQKESEFASSCLS